MTNTINAIKTATIVVAEARALVNSAAVAEAAQTAQALYAETCEVSEKAEEEAKRLRNQASRRAALSARDRKNEAARKSRVVERAAEAVRVAEVALRDLMRSLELAPYDASLMQGRATQELRSVRFPDPDFKDCAAVPGATERAAVCVAAREAVQAVRAALDTTLPAAVLAARNAPPAPMEEREEWRNSGVIWKYRNEQ